MEKQKEKPPCFGIRWEASVADCVRCALSSRCQTITKQMESGKIPPAPKQEKREEIEPIDETVPLDYLLTSLGGRYDRTDEESDEATGIYFKDGDDVVFLVIISKLNGRVKIQIPTKDEIKEKILDSLETVEDVEKVLAELLE